MEHIVDALAWPGATVIMVLSLAFGFRGKVGALFNRRWSFNLPGGITANVTADQQVQAEQKGLIAAPADAAVWAPTGVAPEVHPLYTIVDDNFRQNLEAKYPGDVAAQLAWAIRSHSAVAIEKHHEANFRLIFRSQIIALSALNQRPSANLSEGRPIYDQAMEALEEDRRPTFDQWTGFLFQTGYMQVLSLEGAADPLVGITPLGRDFLQWIIGRGVNIDVKAL